MSFEHASNRKLEIKAENSKQIHGTCISINDIALVFIGPPGSGKSDLALRLIDQGANLIADDRIDIFAKNKKLIAKPPKQITGLLEIRGLGIVKINYKPLGIISLIFRMTSSGDIERLPKIKNWSMHGIILPLFPLDPFSASACAKVRIAIRNLAEQKIIKT